MRRLGERARWRGRRPWGVATAGRAGRRRRWRRRSRHSATRRRSHSCLYHPPPSAPSFVINPSGCEIRRFRMAAVAQRLRRILSHLYALRGLYTCSPAPHKRRSTSTHTRVHTHANMADRAISPISHCIRSRACEATARRQIAAGAGARLQTLGPSTGGDGAAALRPLRQPPRPPRPSPRSTRRAAPQPQRAHRRK